MVNPKYVSMVIQEIKKQKKIRRSELYKKLVPGKMSKRMLNESLNVIKSDFHIEIIEEMQGRQKAVYYSANSGFKREHDEVVIFIQNDLFDLTKLFEEIKKRWRIESLKKKFGEKKPKEVRFSDAMQVYVTQTIVLLINAINSNIARYKMAEIEYGFKKGKLSENIKSLESLRDKSIKFLTSKSRDFLAYRILANNQIDTRRRIWDLLDDKISLDPDTVLGDRLLKRY